MVVACLCREIVEERVNVPNCLHAIRPFGVSAQRNLRACRSPGVIPPLHILREQEIETSDGSIGQERCESPVEPVRPSVENSQGWIVEARLRVGTRFERRSFDVCVLENTSCY